MKFFILFIPFLLFANIEDCKDKNNLRTYFSLEKSKPSLFNILGNTEEGEIQILTDVEKIFSLEKLMANRLKTKHLPPSFASVGIVAEDQYFLWLRDAIRFPSGYEGTYDRIVQKAGKDLVPGAAVLIQLPDNTFVLNINFRHATRSWELELPRGGWDKEESLLDAARREVLEETGYQVDEPIFLGWVNPDSGILSSSVAVFFARANKITCIQHEPTEAIAKNPTFTKEEIKNLLNEGFFTSTIKGKEKKIYVRDSFLTYALCLGEIKNLF